MRLLRYGEPESLLMPNIIPYEMQETVNLGVGMVIQNNSVHSYQVKGSTMEYLTSVQE